MAGHEYVEIIKMLENWNLLLLLDLKFSNGDDKVSCFLTYNAV
jgi:hypothetical protein